MAVESAQTTVPTPAFEATASLRQPGRIEQALFGDDGFTFADLLDIVNPLQHIPVVSTLYRQATGDGIGAFAQIVAGTLLGGPLGLAFGVAHLISRLATGKDIDENLLALADTPASDEADPLVAVMVAGEPGENSAMIPASQVQAYYAGQSLQDSRVSARVAPPNLAAPLTVAAPLDAASRLGSEPATLQALAHPKPVGFAGAAPRAVGPASGPVPFAFQRELPPGLPTARPVAEAATSLPKFARSGALAARAPVMPAADAGWQVGPHIIARDAAARYAVPRPAAPKTVDVAR
ncbi:MAG: hypothetical protein EXQ96_08080 [Alphaproteobacteria bacterium]|nr:hypothetical protein [Alphaproteobacteria bacterium]